jgi:hypothetical protein
VGECPGSAPAARASAADRERVAERLRGACADGRLSLDTFLGRLDVVYGVRTRAELARLVDDLPEPGAVSRSALSSLARGSAWLRSAQNACRAAPQEQLVLPREGRAVVGRSALCDIVVAHEFVSRRHAVLSRDDGRWWLEDCGSRNGTWVNGRRVSPLTEVAPGDRITLADAAYVLVEPDHGASGEGAPALRGRAERRVPAWSDAGRRRGTASV